MASLLLAGAAGAMDMTGLDVLAGIPQATGACPKQPAETPSKAERPQARVQPSKQADCLVDVADLSRFGSDLVLADVRLPAEFERGHAAGAISVSPEALLSKPYWRAKTVLLLGRGKGEPELVELCFALRAQGYRRVAVADGGVIAWSQQGLAWLGLPLDLREAQDLTPEEFLLEMQDPRQRLYLGPEMSGLRRRYPDAATVGAADAGAASAAKRPDRRPVGIPPDRGSARFIVASGRDTARAQLDALLAAKAGRLGFVYTGGEAGLAEAARQTSRLDGLQRLGPKRLGCGL
ncbi:rhodanese-like domain-containing protein [Pelomonas sp. BJYL3]|uniref:rhodanese-like domain-containing protein n=1 Tax=Pelomonas sp. BJYL3 TaxID=2976697 RepID=UPI0022B4BD93|nr:rhodanese-like domain-containing protein [Pelomonas sp. BJYL3]